MTSKANKCSDFPKNVGTGWLAVLGNYDIMRERTARKKTKEKIENREERIKNKRRSEVMKVKNYVKAVLYGYPLLETVREDYQAHIENKAALSVRTDKSAFELAVDLAKEICEKRDLEWLKACVETALDMLTGVEKTLIATRYFGKRRKRKKPFTYENEGSKAEIAAWSERKYFRFQNRLSEKVGAILNRLGLTEEVFEKKFAKNDIFERIYRFVCEGKDQKIAQKAQRWLRG